MSISRNKLDDARRKAARVWEKNSPDLRALFTGSLPDFVNSSSNYLTGEVPVFVFHQVEPERFEQQLAYLARAGYESLNAAQLTRKLVKPSMEKHRQIALTFDDADESAWSIAYPLLKKYGSHAIVFAIPGLVPEDTTVYPNLEDMWVGRATQDEILARNQIQPLCTWQELREMQVSGVFDVQSHSLTHSKVPVSPQVVDFVHPEYDAYFFGNVNLPLSASDNLEQPDREIRLGKPVYQSKPRLSGSTRFIGDLEIEERLVTFIGINGGPAFFTTPGWRKILYKQYAKISEQVGRAGEYETPEEKLTAIQQEFCRSKQILEEKLPGNKVSHFCYPWFQGSTLADRLAAENGYRVVYYGLDLWRNGGEKVQTPVQVKRISDEYLFCLPGEGRQSLVNVWKNRFQHFVNR